MTHAQKPLSPAQLLTVDTLARALIPAGERIPAADQISVDALWEFLGAISPRAPGFYAILARSLDLLALAQTGHRLHRLSVEQRDSVLDRWQQLPALRWLLFGLGFPLKLVHFDHPRVYQRYDCPYHRDAKVEPARWLQQIVPAADWQDGDIECDAVVIGSGAGGAVVAHELAARGHAVLIVEQGEHYRRDAFDGNARRAAQRFYLGRGGLASVGNTVIPITVGRMVGGSTALNTATCFRTPDWVLDEWCERLGSDALSPTRMEPYFERIETALRIAPNEPKYIGPIGDIVARGCERLGWHHFAVRRNAPDCDGQGVCDFGCPTDARLSTNVSYVPWALMRSALMLTGARADRVWVENGRAVGVEVTAPATGRTLRVRARVTVLAGGAIPTPILLQRQGLCTRSGQVGRNLSLHPASALSALFDEDVYGYNHIPQGYGCDEFLRQGILLLGASAMLDLGPAMFNLSGRRFSALVDRYHQIATFGIMIEDPSRNGVVRPGPGGRPLITYNLQAQDVQRLHQGMTRVMQIFEAAGARSFYPTLPRHPAFEGDDAIARFRELQLRPSDFICVSFHPIGTCQMGQDPRRSVVDLQHQAHDLPGLYIVDGSALPGPPGVNPQLTILAVAARAADGIARELQ
ncbi:MAG: GMC family oxidoreductase [Pseudomonadota bacterium]